MTPEQEQELADLVGTVKRAYIATNRCPQIKTNGEQCRRGVMTGSEKCATHSGMNNVNVREKHKQDKALASPDVANLLLAEFREGEEVTDPAAMLRRVAGAMERVAQHFAHKIGDGTTDVDDADLYRWTALVDRLTRICTDLAKLGIFNKALDASEIVFRREYQELAAQLLDDLEEFPEARLHIAERMHAREAAKAGL